MSTLYLDLETYSPVPIKNGTHIYAAGAEVMILAWALDDGPVHVEDLTAAPPSVEFTDLILDAANLVCAHNSHFDRTVMRQALPDLCPPVERWRDTMVKALAHSLPGALGALCDVLNVETDKAKDKAGKQLVQLFCKPRPTTSKIQRATRETHPVEWDRFLAYAGSDITSMRVVDKKLPSWNYTGAELALWHLDQRVNDRGVAVDVDLAHAAISAVAKEQKILAARTSDLTLGLVGAATQRDAMLAHMLAAYGVDLPDLQQSTIERRMSDPDLPVELRELMAIRLQASTTSTAKYKALANAVSSDGRLRGTLQFCGASRTGRWAGRLFQPQNLPRPTLKQDEIDAGIDALKAGCADLVAPDVMRLTSSAIRGCIVAPPGRKLVVSDLANIEGRVLALLAGEEWKLQAFRDYDAGTGPDLYALSYAKSFGVTPEAVMENKETGDGSMRQIGKVQELALGYEGGVGAFLTFSAAYGIDLEDMGAKAYGSIPARIMNEANSALAYTKLNKRSTFGLSDEAWIVCDSFKRMWRQAHPATAALWKDLQELVVKAIVNPGTTFELGPRLRDAHGPLYEAAPRVNLKARRDGSWLRIGLPSGRALCYPSPALKEDGTITYMGVNQYSRKWSRLSTYGGKLVENVTQAVARDVLAYPMPMIEAAGYDLVLSVHDENLTEAPDSPEFNPDHLAGIMTTLPPWAKGLPLAAAGFEAYRYKKD